MFSSQALFAAGNALYHVNNYIIFQVWLKILPHVKVYTTVNDLQFGWFNTTTSALEAQKLQ